jgi:hypothetical protein
MKGGGCQTESRYLRATKSGSGSSNSIYHVRLLSAAVAAAARAMPTKHRVNSRHDMRHIAHVSAPGGHRRLDLPWLISRSQHRHVRAPRLGDRRVCLDIRIRLRDVSVRDLRIHLVPLDLSSAAGGCGCRLEAASHTFAQLLHLGNVRRADDPPASASSQQVTSGRRQRQKNLLLLVRACVRACGRVLTQSR